MENITQILNNNDIQIIKTIIPIAGSLFVWAVGFILKDVIKDNSKEKIKIYREQFEKIYLPLHKLIVTGDFKRNSVKNLMRSLYIQYYHLMCANLIDTYMKEVDHFYDREFLYLIKDLLEEGSVSEKNDDEYLPKFRNLIECDYNWLRKKLCYPYDRYFINKKICSFEKNQRLKEVLGFIILTMVNTILNIVVAKYIYPQKIVMPISYYFYISFIVSLIMVCILNYNKIKDWIKVRKANKKGR